MFSKHLDYQEKEAFLTVTYKLLPLNDAYCVVLPAFHKWSTYNNTSWYVW